MRQNIFATNVITNLPTITTLTHTGVLIRYTATRKKSLACKVPDWKLGYFGSEGSPGRYPEWANTDPISPDIEQPNFNTIQENTTQELTHTIAPDVFLPNVIF